MGLTALWLMALAGITIVNRSRDLMSESNLLLASEERLRLAMEGAGMGTWDRDLRTKKTIWSDTHFRMLGYSPPMNGEASVEMWQSRLHPDDLDRVLEAQEQSQLNRTIFNTEYRILRADDGKIAWLAVFGRFFYNESGEAIRFLGVSFDITQRKDLEREVLEVAADEQRKIGHELHDSVGQELTGLGLMANALHQSLPTTAREQRIVAALSEGSIECGYRCGTCREGLCRCKSKRKASGPHSTIWLPEPRCSPAFKYDSIVPIASKSSTMTWQRNCFISHRRL